MQVETLMTENVVAMLANDSFGSAMKVMKSKRIRHIPVVDKKGTFLGLITHRDLLAASASYLTKEYTKNRQSIWQIPLKQLMHRKIQTTTPKADLREVARLMKTNKWGCLPVLQGKRLAGIITSSDFLALSINLLSMHERLQRTLSKNVAKSGK